MALKKDVLNNYFQVPPKAKEKASNPTVNDAVIKKDYNFYRIFDDPIREQNSGHTQDKFESNQGQNTEQSQDKLKQNIRQIEKTRTISKDNLRTQSGTDYRTELGLNSDKLRTNYTYTSLNFGLQRTIVLFIHDCCKQNRDKVTPPLSIEHIANACSTTKLSAQKTIQRLEKKQLIVRKAYQNGRGGWTQYELPEKIFQEILQIEVSNNLKTNLGHIQDNIRSETRTQPGTSSPSSSFNNLNTTTTAEELPPEWEEIDLTELARRNIRFGKQHLQQVYPYLKNNYESYDLQESIDAFVFDLDSKHITIRSSSVGMLLKIFRAGELYISQHYISPENKLLLENAERAKQRKQQLEEAKYQEWLAKPENQEKIKRNLPAGMLIPFERNEPQAHNYIREYIFKTIKNDY